MTLQNGFDPVLTDQFARALERSTASAVIVLGRHVSAIVAHSGHPVSEVFDHVIGQLDPRGLDAEKLCAAVICAGEGLGAIEWSRPQPDLQIPGRRGIAPE